MKLTERVQYGLLLVFYLCRAGRARLVDVARNLDLCLSRLQRVAYQLRRKRVISSVRGPGGGYEVTGDPTVRDVFSALNPLIGIPLRQQNLYAKGQAEHRALAQFVQSVQNALAPLLRRKVRKLGMELVATEMAKLDHMTALVVC